MKKNKNIQDIENKIDKEYTYINTKHVVILLSTLVIFTLVMLLYGITQADSFLVVSSMLVVLVVIIVAERDRRVVDKLDDEINKVLREWGGER